MDAAGSRLALLREIPAVLLAVSIIGYVDCYRAIGIAGVARIAPPQFAQPAVSLIFAVILFDDHLTFPILIAMVVVLVETSITRRASRSR